MRITRENKVDGNHMTQVSTNPVKTQKFSRSFLTKQVQMEAQVEEELAPLKVPEGDSSEQKR